MTSTRERIESLKSVLESIKSCTQPIDGHTDPNSLMDCWNQVDSDILALTALCEEMEREKWNNLQERAFRESLESGWDPEQKNTFAEEVAHLHEEISEAFRAFRAKKNCAPWIEGTKPCGVPSEFADAIIGMLYNAQLHGFSIFEAIEAKLRYNKTRNYVTEGLQLHDPTHFQPLPSSPTQTL